MPRFSDYSNESLFLLLEPWTNGSSIPSLEAIRSALPKKKNNVILLSFVNQEDGLFLLNVRNRQDSPQLVTVDNCREIYSQIMRENVYLELIIEQLWYVPPKKIFDEALDRFSKGIQTEAGLPVVLAMTIAEYVLDQKEIKAICDRGFFNKPEQKESKESPEGSVSPKVKKLHTRNRPLLGNEEFKLRF